MKLTCKYCTKVNTKECPIRVWGRNEGNNLLLDANISLDKDYCSRMEINITLHIKETEKEIGGE